MEYDPVDQLVGATLRESVAGTLLKRFVYGYDSAGNRTSESVGTSSASSVSSAKVNNLNQLTNTVAGSGPVRFTGHLNEPGQSVTVGTNAAQIKQTTNFTGNAELAVGTNTVAVKATDYSGNSTTNSYQIVVTNNGVAKTLKYDLNGNLTNSFTATETNVYEWDGADRNTAIIVMTVSATNRSEFTYDGLGRRTRILELTNGVGQSTNIFIWCGTELCEERDSTGATVTKRFFRQGEQIAGTAYFYTRDHLGSVREMVDGSGTVRARYDYDPYGRRTKISGDLDASFGFTGHYWHQNSGLWLTLYRAYDSDTGRWISRDPIEEAAGLNFYGYVGSDPINNLDPLGLDILDSLSSAASSGYGHGGALGNALGWGANAAEALIGGVLGGNVIKDLASKSGAASGCGNTGAAIGYGAGAAAMILLNAFTFAAPKGAILNAGKWFKSPYLYEVGSLTFPKRVFDAFSHLGPVKRGAELLVTYGSLRNVLKVANQSGWRDWAVTLAMGPTTGGLLGTLGLNQLVPALSDQLGDPCK